MKSNGYIETCQGSMILQTGCKRCEKCKNEIIALMLFRENIIRAEKDITYIQLQIGG